MFPNCLSLLSFTNDYYAFLHLALTDTELEDLGYRSDFVNKIVNPTTIYHKWFQASGLDKIGKISGTVTNDPVDSFIVNNDFLKQRILENFKKVSLNFREFPEFQMQQSFHDFVVKYHKRNSHRFL
jgi:hypothetical protein